MKIRNWGIGICLSLFGTFCLGGCSGSSPQPVSRTVTVFDTVVTITVYDKDSEDVLDACVGNARIIMRGLAELRKEARFMS